MDNKLVRFARTIRFADPSLQHAVDSPNDLSMLRCNACLTATLCLLWVVLPGYARLSTVCLPTDRMIAREDYERRKKSKAGRSLLKWAGGGVRVCGCCGSGLDQRAPPHHSTPYDAHCCSSL